MGSSAQDWLVTVDQKNSSYVAVTYIVLWPKN
jgi:hypothetical protein